MASRPRPQPTPAQPTPAPPAPPPSGPARPASRRDDEPVLPEVSSDERDLGWGDDPGAGRRDDDWYRRERPPHHE